MPLPAPDDLTSLVLRTDFSDDEKWEAVQVEVDSWSDHKQAVYVSDRTYDSVDIQWLVAADGPADADKIFYLFVADSITMNDPEHPLLAVDLADEPRRTFRITPRAFPVMSANLCIVDSSGTYRGLNPERSDEEVRLLTVIQRERPWRAWPGRTIYVLEGTHIRSLDDFWRVWFEAIGGDGSDFGQTLAAFDDALSRRHRWLANAVKTDFVIEWQDHQSSQESLGRSFVHLVKILERHVPGRLKLC